MSLKKCFTLCILAGMLLTAACSTLPAAQPSAAPTTQPGSANMPNPASVFCEKNGGKLEIRADKNGGQYGVCVFPDKSECDEWAYFRGECKPGDSLKKAANQPGDWLTYRSAALGYSFQYPADCVIEVAQDGGSVTVTGPLVNDEHWPAIYFSHPKGLAEYAPPADANLEQWMKERNLLMGERRANLRVAGLEAIHLFQKGSPQAYNADRYYFARAGQLYNVVFLHTGGKEDWTLYNRFLENIKFEK